MLPIIEGFLSKYIDGVSLSSGQAFTLNSDVPKCWIGRPSSASEPVLIVVLFVQAHWEITASRLCIDACKLGNIVKISGTASSASQLSRQSPPRLGKIVAQKRLLKTLNDVQIQPVTWITATAGTGLITLVSSYLEH